MKSILHFKGEAATNLCSKKFLLLNIKNTETTETDRGSAKYVNWSTFVFTKVVISDSKVLLRNVSDKIWYQILIDHWFWNLAFVVFLKSWTKLTNHNAFSITLLPIKDNRGSKSSWSNFNYGQSSSMHLFSTPTS